MPIGLALLVSVDPATIRQFICALRQLSISPDICQDATTAIHLLNRRRFEAVIVDLQLGEQSGLILDAVRNSSANRTAVTFGIGSSAGDTAILKKNSCFVFDKPLSAQSIRSTLKPAYGLILRERRRYFRCPVSIPVVIVRRTKPEVRCYSVNISEGGMALSTFVPLGPGEKVQVQFTLPGQKIPLLTESTICWWETGHLGVRFVSLSKERKCELQVWLSRKLEEMLPEFVAGAFQRTDTLLRPFTPILPESKALMKTSTTSAPLAAADGSGKLPVCGRTRRWQRCSLDVPVRVIVGSSNSTKFYEGRGNELSEGGMAVTAGVELKPGRDVAIEFTPPYAGPPIRVRGTVRNRTGYRYGVEFLIEGTKQYEQVARLRLMLESLSPT
jgi:ActR/RegA family two-component response regulator